VKKRFLDGADGDGDGKVEADAVLQLVDAGAGQLPFFGLELIFEVELDGQTGVRGRDGMDELQAATNLFRRLESVAEDALGGFSEADGAQPLAMIDGAGCDVDGVMAGEDGAVGGVEDLGGGGTDEHAAERAGVRGHDDEVESVACGLGDTGGGVSGVEDARVLRRREFLGEEGVEVVAGDLLVLDGDFGFGAIVKLESVVTGGVEDVDERDAGGPDGGGALDVAGHGDGGGGEVDGEKDVGNDGHAAVPSVKEDVGAGRDGAGILGLSVQADALPTPSCKDRTMGAPASRRVGRSFGAASVGEGV